MYNKSNHYNMTKFHPVSCVVPVTVTRKRLSGMAALIVSCVFALKKKKSQSTVSLRITRTDSFSDFCTFTCLLNSLASVFVFN